jgi:hypothetical protein
MEIKGGIIMNTIDSKEGLSPAQRIDNQIAELSGWRGQKLARLRELIHEAAPDIVEEWKWDTAVWSQKGNVAAGAAFKDHIKLNFFKGAALEDPRRLFNAGLEAKASRSIDFSETDEIPETALRDLIRAAVALNLSAGKKK